jgi:hypothetical protein
VQIGKEGVYTFRLGVPRKHAASAAADEGVEDPSACAQAVVNGGGSLRKTASAYEGLIIRECSE